MSKETLGNSGMPATYGDVVGLMSKVVPEYITWEDDVGYPSWDGKIRGGLELSPEVASDADLGDKVQCQIIGDASIGIAVILRSRNLFDTRRYGYYIQPTRNDEGLNGFEIWKAPAVKPRRNNVYWGVELLDRNKAQFASPELSDGLISTLLAAAS